MKRLYRGKEQRPPYENAQATFSEDLYQSNENLITTGVSSRRKSDGFPEANKMMRKQRKEGRGAPQSLLVQAKKDIELIASKAEQFKKKFDRYKH
eukprot:CAMPEP_0170551598 /NCGR_PEP_ID=MMETSP0211-20121228/9594_1 /TAXON_ID=311385 /ORGANISM="Pseudokeronopsis sp., Strain OXSARD2" /LENGTH=94 /DNA_ID=CAMNT_0010858869 /DNA_START=1559 /DNA_END=1843 /DNA_ORIENTATION=+